MPLLQAWWAHLFFIVITAVFIIIIIITIIFTPGFATAPRQCRLIFLSSVHHHHHHHHFHYASLHLSSTPDSKLTFPINPSHHSLPHLFGRIFMTISGLNCSSFFVFFLSFLFDSCDRLSWFNLHVKFLRFPFLFSVTRAFCRRTNSLQFTAWSSAGSSCWLRTI